MMSSQHKHGSLGGHVLPGSFFIMWSIWWFVAISGSWIQRAQSNSGVQQRPQVTRYGASHATRVPLEPTLKLIACSIGILGELYFSHHANWRYGMLVMKFTRSNRIKYNVHIQIFACAKTCMAAVSTCITGPKHGTG
jgi:hypothetical protein